MCTKIIFHLTSGTKGAFLFFNKFASCSIPYFNFLGGKAYLCPETVLDGSLILCHKEFFINVLKSAYIFNVVRFVVNFFGIKKYIKIFKTVISCNVIIACLFWLIVFNFFQQLVRFWLFISDFRMVGLYTKILQQ